MAAAAAAVAGRRSRVRRTMQAAATDSPPAGVARPGDAHVQRICSPAPASRALGAITIHAVDEAGRRPDVSAKLGGRSRAKQAVAQAVTAQRAGDHRWRDEKVDESTARVVGAIDGTLPNDGSVWTVSVAGSWEGDRMRCTYRRWTCGPDGHWPAEPATTWTRSAPDYGTVVIATLEGFGSRHASVLVEELQPQLAAFVTHLATD